MNRKHHKGRRRTVISGLVVTVTVGRSLPVRQAFARQRPSPGSGLEAGKGVRPEKVSGRKRCQAGKGAETEGAETGTGL